MGTAEFFRTAREKCERILKGAGERKGEGAMGARGGKERTAREYLKNSREFRINNGL